MTALVLHPATTALVVIDLQKGITGGTTVPHDATSVVEQSARLAEACRAAGIAVMVVHVDPGPHGVLFPTPLADRPRPTMAMPPDFAELDARLGLQPSDVRITKHQPNAFFGTDLEIQLRRRGILTIILCGIATNVGVEATARSAHERGFEQVFAEDAMAAREADLHEHSVKRIFPTIGRVRPVADILEALNNR